MIRVVILSDSPFYALRDGAQGRGAGQGATWLPGLAEAFAAHGDFDLTWLNLGAPSEAPVDVHLHGQRFLIVPHLKPTHDALLRYRPARWRLRRALARLKPDLVHVWGSERSYPSVLRGLNIPSVYSIQGNLTHYAAIGGQPDNWFWKLQSGYESRWVPHATAVACESPWSAELARAFWPGADTRVIEWGVHRSFYEVEWSPDPHLPYLLYCGGLDWRKGIDILFDALEWLPQRDWSLRLAGEGSWRARLEARRLPRVEWLGNLKWDELKRQMAGAWGLVMPTRADTGPSVVKEARVVGLPVIASVHGGLRDYITPGRNGLRVEPLDGAHLAAAMQELMGGFDRMRKLGLACLESDRESFRPERAAAAFGDLYRELAGCRHPDST
jgi:glycosyltransferase involved in cell wall biosynthesis